MMAIWIICALFVLAGLAFAHRVRGARRTYAGGAGGGEGVGHFGGDCDGGDGGGD